MPSDTGPAFNAFANAETARLLASNMAARITYLGRLNQRFSTIKNGMGYNEKKLKGELQQYIDGKIGDTAP